jgi:hypothetical protein
VVSDRLQEALANHHLVVVLANHRRQAVPLAHHQVDSVNRHQAGLEEVLSRKALVVVPLAHHQAVVLANRQVVRSARHQVVVSDHRQEAAALGNHLVDSAASRQAAVLVHLQGLEVAQTNQQEVLVNLHRLVLVSRQVVALANHKEEEEEEEGVSVNHNHKGEEASDSHKEEEEASVNHKGEEASDNLKEEEDSVNHKEEDSDNLHSRVVCPVQATISDLAVLTMDLALELMVFKEAKALVP